VGDRHSQHIERYIKYDMEGMVLQVWLFIHGYKISVVI